MVVAQDYIDPRCLQVIPPATPQNASCQSGGGEEARAVTLEEDEHSRCEDGKSQAVGYKDLSRPPLPAEGSIHPLPISTASVAKFSPIRPTSVASPMDPIQQESRHMILGSPSKAINRSTIYEQSPKVDTPAKASPDTLSLDTAMSVDNDARQILYRPLQVPMMPAGPSLITKRADGHVRRRVRKLRRRVQLLRIQIHGQRNIVDLKRDAKSDADEQYIKRIRTNHVAPRGELKTDHSEVLILEKLWRLCQTARDEYGPVEDALISMENRLEVEENKLELAEDRLYQTLDLKEAQPESPVSTPAHVSDQDSDQDSDENLEESSGQSSPISKTIDELDYDDYLIRLGNQDIARENYEELLNEKAMLEAEQKRRRPIGKELDAEDLHFLIHFEETMEPVKKELDEVSADVERLKRHFIKKGLIDAAGNPTEQGMEYEMSVEASEFELASNHSKLSWQEAVTESNEVDSRTSPWQAIYHNFINLWLLDKLRSSAIEIMILASFVAVNLNIIDNRQWPLEALRLWDDGGELEVSTSRYEQVQWSDKSSSKRRSRQLPMNGQCQAAAYTIRISSKSAPGRISGPFVLRLTSNVKPSVE